MTTPTPLALSLARQLDEYFYIGRQDHSPDGTAWLPASRDELVAIIETEIAPLRAAIKDLTVAAMRSSEHRAYRDDESRPWGSDEVVITRVDIGPTSTAAAAKRAWRSALPTLGVLGLTEAELVAAFYQSCSHP